MKSWAYCRYSTSLQDDSTSIERQLHLAKEFAERNNIPFAGHFEDRAVSGFKTTFDERDGLQEFLNNPDVQSGDYLLVEKLDRLTRTDVKTTMSLVWEIASRGIRIVTTMDGRRLNSDDIGSLITTIVEADKGNAYVKELSARSKKAKMMLMEKQIKGEGKVSGSNVPDWLRVSDDGMSYEFIEERVAVIKRILEMSMTMGNSTITNILNDENIPCWKKSKYNKWTGAMIKTLAANHRLHGEKRTRNFGVVPDFFPAVLSKEDWLVIRDAVSKRAFDPSSKYRPTSGKKSKLSNLFSGMARCANCNHSLHFKNSGRQVVTYAKGVKYVNNRITTGYLICSDRCTKSHVRYTDFERALINYSKSVDWSSISKVESNLDSIKGSILMTRETLSTVSSEIDNLANAVATTGNMTLISLLESKENEKRDLLSKIDELEVQYSAELAIEKRLREEDVADAASKVVEGDTEARLKFNSVLKNRIDWMKIGLDNSPRPYIAIKWNDKVEYIFPYDDKSYHHGFELSGDEVEAINSEE